MDKEQSVSDVSNKEQPATDVPDKKQAIVDTSRTALATQIMGNLETLKTDIAGLKADIDSIKIQISESSKNKDLVKLLIDIEHDCKSLIANSEKADSMPELAKDFKGLFNHVSANFDKFNNALQTLSEKQSTFIMRLERITDSLGVPGLKTTWANKAYRRIKTIVYVTTLMLTGIGLLRLGEFIWTLMQNQK